MDKFIGTFKLEKSENFDEFMEARGVPWLLRKALKLASATKIITDNHNGTYRLENKAMKSTDWTFKLDETFEGLAFDGKTHRITFTISGDTLKETHELLDGADKDTFKYDIEGDYLVLTLTNKELTARRYFKRQ